MFKSLLVKILHSIDTLYNHNFSAHLYILSNDMTSTSRLNGTLSPSIPSRLGASSPLRQKWIFLLFFYFSFNFFYWSIKINDKLIKDICDRFPSDNLRPFIKTLLIKTFTNLNWDLNDKLKMSKYSKEVSEVRGYFFIFFIYL